MSNLDKFKKYVSNHPEFIDHVRSGNATWQGLYELYDIYGEDDKVWSKYLSQDNSINIKGILNSLKNINIDSLEENISSIQKAIGLVEEFTKSEKSEEVKSKEENIASLFGDK